MFFIYKLDPFFQAVGRGFDPRLPLHFLEPTNSRGRSDGGLARAPRLAGPDTRGAAEVGEADAEEIAETVGVGGGVGVGGETEEDFAVVTLGGTADAEFVTGGDLRIRGEHPAAHGIERHRGARHVRADHVE
jgi:hypothetical protein